ncbi:hypothetical protein EJB05_28838, partial [Eragrostis curvula]
MIAGAIPGFGRLSGEDRQNPSDSLKRADKTKLGSLETPDNFDAGPTVSLSLPSLSLAGECMPKRGDTRPASSAPGPSSVHTPLREGAVGDLLCSSGVSSPLPHRKCRNTCSSSSSQAATSSWSASSDSLISSTDSSSPLPQVITAEEPLAASSCRALPRRVVDLQAGEHPTNLDVFASPAVSLFPRCSVALPL